MWAPTVSSDELYHHGILGQRWGKQNGPPYPLGSEDHSSSEKKAGWRKSLSSKASKVTEAVKKKASEVEDSYISKMSSRYQDYPYNMSKKEADEEAKRKAELAKKLLIGSAVAVGTVAAIYAYRRYGIKYTDEIIKAGTTLKNLSDDPKRMEIGKAFYESHKAMDTKAYMGAFGRSLGENKFLNEAVVNKDIKIASVKNAEKIYKELMNNNQHFRELVQEPDTFAGIAKKMHKATGKSDYEIFNTFDLINDDRGELQKIFYDALKQKGYSGVKDVNDQLYSGFNTKANIIFDKEFITKQGSRKLTDLEIDSNKGVIWLKMLEGTKPTTVAMLAGGGSLAALNSFDEKVEQKSRRSRKRKRYA